MKLMVNTTKVNLDTMSRFADEWEPADYDIQFLRDWARGEYGRYGPAVFHDTAYGTIQTGWTFISRQKYGDHGTDETYLQETWYSFRVVDEDRGETVPVNVKTGVAILGLRYGDPETQIIAKVEGAKVVPMIRWNPRRWVYSRLKDFDEARRLIEIGSVIPESA